MLDKVSRQAWSAQLAVRGDTSVGNDIRIAWAELASRIDELNLIVFQVMKLEAEINKLAKAGADYNPSVLTLVKILTEAFYHGAWRVIEICKVDLGGELKTFKPLGVRDVRNQLLVHVSDFKKKNGLVSPAIVIGDGKGNGPRLQMMSVEHIDAGLYENARQFAEELSDRLSSMGFHG